MKFLTFSNLGNISLCFVFSTHLSNTSNIAGNVVTAVITPIKTPFAITKPISFPNVKFILHNAKNPAIVVNELPSTDTNVFAIAVAIASSLFEAFSFSAL